MLAARSLALVVLAGAPLAQGEVGANDFRLSDLGQDGDPLHRANFPDVAYSSAPERYLVVWEGSDDTLAVSESEIWGQLVDARSGAEIGGDFRISDVGNDGTNQWLAREPAVAYNAVRDEFLVVWYADDPKEGVVDNEFEIWGQRIDAATGAEVGPNDFRISFQGGTGATDYDALRPDVVALADDRYLVVWEGDTDAGPLVDDEMEIYGQILRGTGAAFGAAFRISAVGTDGTKSEDAFGAAAAFNPVTGELFVVWEGDPGGTDAFDDSEIFGRRVDADGNVLDPLDRQLSDMGPQGTAQYVYATLPAVACRAASGEWLVVWHGVDDASGYDEHEIFGQLLDPTGSEIGANDFQISWSGPPQVAPYQARVPSLAYSASDDEFLVAWRGEDDALAVNEKEAFVQRLDGATLATVGALSARVSDIGTDGVWTSGISIQSGPSVAASGFGEYLVVWAGDEPIPPLVDNEFEIWGQRLHARASSLTYDVNQLSLGAGGAQSLVLDAGSAHAGRVAVLAGSASGNHPAFPLGSVVVPLAIDGYFWLVLSSPGVPLAGSPAILDGSGGASFTLQVPPAAAPSLAGSTLHHAAIAIDATTFEIPFASNAVPVTLLP